MPIVQEQSKKAASRNPSYLFQAEKNSVSFRKKATTKELERALGNLTTSKEQVTLLQTRLDTLEKKEAAIEKIENITLEKFLKKGNWINDYKEGRFVFDHIISDYKLYGKINFTL